MANYTDAYEEAMSLKEMAEELGINFDEVGDEICDDLRHWANDLFNTDDTDLNEFMQGMFRNGIKSLQEDY